MSLFFIYICTYSHEIKFSSLSVRRVLQTGSRLITTSEPPRVPRALPTLAVRRYDVTMTYNPVCLFVYSSFIYPGRNRNPFADLHSSGV